MTEPCVEPANGEPNSKEATYEYLFGRKPQFTIEERTAAEESDRDGFQRAVFACHDGGQVRSQSVSTARNRSVQEARAGKSDLYLQRGKHRLVVGAMPFRWP